MQACKAWKIEIAPDTWVAVGQSNLVEYIHGADLIDIPLSPKGCNRVLKWKELLLPVIDIKSKLGYTTEPSAMNKIAVIYTENKLVDEPKKALISVKILSTPERIEVDDKKISTEIGLIPIPLQASVKSLFYSGNQLTAIHDWRKLMAIF